MVLSERFQEKDLGKAYWKSIFQVRKDAKIIIVIEVISKQLYVQIGMLKLHFGTCIVVSSILPDHFMEVQEVLLAELWMRNNI